MNKMKKLLLIGIIFLLINCKSTEEIIYLQENIAGKIRVTVEIDKRFDFIEKYTVNKIEKRLKLTGYNSNMYKVIKGEGQKNTLIISSGEIISATFKPLFLPERNIINTKYKRTY